MKLLSLFHQSHQELPFPRWKWNFMLGISNPSVTSISNLAEVCGSNKKSISHAVKWFPSLAFMSIPDPMETT